MTDTNNLDPGAEPAQAVASVTEAAPPSQMAPAGKRDHVPNQKKQGKKNRPHRQPSENDVLARAKRLAAGQLAEQRVKFAKALGLKDADDKLLDQKLAELQKEREAGMSGAERLEGEAKELRAQQAQIQVENVRLKSELNKARKDKDRELQRRKDLEIEGELRQAAIASGIKDGHAAKFALQMFAEHVRDHDDADPAKFFEDLKGKQDLKYLFVEKDVPAGPRVGLPTETVERSIANPPAPPAPGKASQTEDVDVSKMSKKDFADHSQQKYGFRPNYN